MIYPGYVWITYGWYSERWWEEGKMKKTDNCSNEEILSVLNGAIALTHYPFAITTHPQAHSLQHVSARLNFFAVIACRCFV